MLIPDTVLPIYWCEVRSSVLPACPPDARARGVVVERRTATGGSDALQRVEEEPLMFQGAPPRFDHGIRELQLGEGQDPAQHSRGDEVVN